MRRVGVRVGGRGWGVGGVCGLGSAAEGGGVTGWVCVGGLLQLPGGMVRGGCV